MRLLILLPRPSVDMVRSSACRAAPAYAEGDADDNEGGVSSSPTSSMGFPLPPRAQTIAIVPNANAYGKPVREPFHVRGLVRRRDCDCDVCPEAPSSPPDPTCDLSTRSYHGQSTTAAAERAHCSLASLMSRMVNSASSSKRSYNSDSNLMCLRKSVGRRVLMLDSTPMARICWKKPMRPVWGFLTSPFPRLRRHPHPPPECPLLPELAPTPAHQIQPAESRSAQRPPFWQLCSVEIAAAAVVKTVSAS